MPTLAAARVRCTRHRPVSDARRPGVDSVECISRDRIELHDNSVRMSRAATLGDCRETLTQWIHRAAAPSLADAGPDAGPDAGAVRRR
jgi:hypothetical protein